MKEKFSYTQDRAYLEILNNLNQKSISPINLILTPPNIKADLAFPCFKLAKELKTNPLKLAQDLANQIKFSKESLIEKAEPQNAYLNFNFNLKNFIKNVLEDFKILKENYGASIEGENKIIIIDYSSPNIAKPLTIGHLRSTIIGQALYNIYSFLGYKVIGDNHLGDWGTQFGKLICAYKKWGDPEKVRVHPIKELLNLYIKFHQEIKKDLNFEENEKDEEIAHPLEKEARIWFKRMEDGDKEALELWKWFLDLSLKELNSIYERLGIKFDLMQGESFYNSQTQDIIQDAKIKGIVEEDSEGTLLIRLDRFGINTPLLIQKRDGASLYATRDLAAAKYRALKFHPEMILYVTGSEQKFYFKQWITVFQKLLGYNTRCLHIDFGLVSLKEGKISTRVGRVIFLEELINETILRARKILEEKRPELSSEKMDKIAEIIGIGAIKYNDLSQNRIKDITFNWEQMLNFEGDSAPYLQYSYSRSRSILRKTSLRELDFFIEFIKLPEEINLIKKFAQFNLAIRQAEDTFHPHLIANYLFDLAKSFSIFYNSVPVLTSKPLELLKSRLFLVDFYAVIMKNGLKLLGIEVPEEM